MSQIDTIVDRSHDKLFLEQPSELPELDTWVEERIKSQRRFTFTERDVLQVFWHAGEDIRLREDSRFREVILSNPTSEVQWQLKRQILTNQHLYEILEDDVWDGKDLYQYLEQLDHSTPEDTFHIFCVHDQRFLVSPNEYDSYCVSLRIDRKKFTLTLEQKKSIDQLASQLLALFPTDSRNPWSTYVLLEHVKRLSSAADLLVDVLPAALENWLLQREEWAHVGRDLWFPKKLVPSFAKSHRYAVLPVPSVAQDTTLPLPNNPYRSSVAQEITHVSDEAGSYQKQQSTKASVKWKLTLRTVHINEGYLPIPTQARVSYPQAKNLSSIVAIPSIWFADASEMIVWLDTEKHQLYGPDLLDQLAFEGAGTVLEVLWTATGITFNAIGIDANVAEEEVRLVDLTELAHVRSTTLESYRTSLRTIMTSAQDEWIFPELYNELCSRQQHKPNRSTIRCILSSSPEFVFMRAEKKWKLHAEITPEIGARALRKATLIAKDASIADSETLSIAERITKSRERLAHLRSLYIDGGQISS